jgi:hypothetical protein
MALLSSLWIARILVAVLLNTRSSHCDTPIYEKVDSFFRDFADLQTEPSIARQITIPRDTHAAGKR